MFCHGALAFMWQESLCNAVNLGAVSTCVSDPGKVTLVDKVEMDGLV
jgi:hypothetical protein